MFPSGCKDWKSVGARCTHKTANTSYTAGDRSIARIARTGEVDAFVYAQPDGLTCVDPLSLYEPFVLPPFAGFQKVPSISRLYAKRVA
jgi:hypothetical protein